jgi:tRNA A-37 threonylcarbamoyl transferase component Bud32
MATEIISEANYLQLHRDARVLESDGHGDKVLLLGDGRIMKLFRFKKLLTGARIYPYNRRFARNRDKLVAKGIPTVSEVRCFKLPSRQRHGVFYQPLPGETLRRLGMAGRLDTALCARAGRFVADIHAKGILFRSIHLGNVVLGADGALGLIDIADLSLQPWPLLKSQRRRNFLHMFRPVEEDRYLGAAQREALLSGYFSACPPRLAANERFRANISRAALGCPT